jgi:uncharacterized protein (DUF736 family)
LAGGALPIGLDATRREIGAANREKDRRRRSDTSTQERQRHLRGSAQRRFIRTDIDIIPNRDKTAESHPDCRLLIQGFEIGEGLSCGQNCSMDVSLSLASLEFRPRRLYAHLGRAAGQDDGSVLALI